MNDRKWMTHALNLARLGAGHTAPNPMVGCVIVKNDKILAEGYHTAFGQPHAEQMALAKVDEMGVNLADATLYVTLEPCNHYGKTPPCAELIAAHHPARVVIATKDPNHIASGGMSRLKAAGIQVTYGVCEADARTLNAAFFHHLETGRPLVTWKVAATVDGLVGPAQCAGPKAYKHLSSHESDAEVQRLRHQMGAIMIGAGTMRSDNPLLTDRSGLQPVSHPVRVIVGHDSNMLRSSRIVETAHEVPTIFATAGSEQDYSFLRQAGLQIWHRPTENVPLEDLLNRLGAKGINSILLEGGATLAGRMFSAQLVDRIIVILTPKLMGLSDSKQKMLAPLSIDIEHALQLDDVHVTTQGKDIWYEANVRRPACLQD